MNNVCFEPDSTTPKGTVVMKKNGTLAFFSRLYTEGRTGIPELDKGFWLYHNPLRIVEEYYSQAFISVEDDLQFRAFINAPEEYKWFAIDEDNTGHVFINEPIFKIHQHHFTGECGEWDDDSGMGGFQVGYFPQYVRYCENIKIRRKDS